MKPHYIVRLLLMIACSCALGAITTTMGQSAPSAAQKQPTAKTNVAIFIFDGVQIIDYAGPYEVFGGARFNVYTVAPQKQPITTIYGMKVTPDYDFSNHPKPDILVIPGGGRSSANPSSWKPGLPVEDDPRIFKWVQDTAAQSQYVLSVCNGAFTLARAGLLDGLSATTTMPFLARLKEVAPRTKVITDKRWVDNGKIVTSGGLSAGIDAALHVVAKVLGPGDAQFLALGLEYRWDPEGEYSRAALADKYMRFLFQGIEAESLARQGDRDCWENKWKVSAASAAAILSLVDNTLANNKTYGPPSNVKWVRQDAAPAKNDSRSLWQFVDEEGQKWTGVASVEPFAGEANKFLLTLKIARNDDAARQ